MPWGAAVWPAEPDLPALTVLDALQQHIALLDGQGTVRAVNRAWRDFGLQRGAPGAGDSAVGMNYLQVCAARAAPPEAALAGQGIQAVLAGEQRVFELEYPCADPTGAACWYLMRVSPLAGLAGGALVSHEDITPRRQQEQQRAGLVNELLVANRELREFAYVVSHDLKAPLRGISSLATWLVEDHAEALGGEGAAQLKLIVARAKRLSALIDGILAYSRAGRTQVEREPVALDVLVQNTIDLLAPPPHIQVHITSALPNLQLHAVKMQQVFQNLLSNAIDFNDKPQGRITVACQREGADWHFSVADNGPGIEERHFERIFQLFQTLSARDERERTGVGLALVKKIVELEGGRLWVASALGSGTTFHFTLPAVAEASA